MYLEVLDQERIDLLGSLSKEKQVTASFYLGGGTALSLQLGLRKSYDFDFFSKGPFDEEALFKHLAEVLPYQVNALRIAPGTCDLSVDGIQVSFFHYPYCLVGDKVIAHEFSDMQLASIEDIAAMKIAAIGSRGDKKDFFDLYYIYRQPGFSTKVLLDILYEKYGRRYNFTYMGMGLGYFDDAERQGRLDTFAPYDWEEIKSFFVGEQQRFLDAYLASEADFELE